MHTVTTPVADLHFLTCYVRTYIYVHYILYIIPNIVHISILINCLVSSVSFFITVARGRSNKPYNMARDLTIPSAIDEMLPVNITELVHFVPRIAHKWSEIGTYLNMLAKVRELTDAPGSTHVKISVILDSWIESGKDVSWSFFVDVLDKPGVDLGAVGVDVKQYLYEKGDHKSVLV